MAAGEEKIGDFYTVLGLRKECSEAELRIAYKKLAMRWHPDKCSASGNHRRMEEAKEKFQEIQKAYSVLSDSSKRFLYDVGIYDNEDDNDEKGMGDFIGEIAQMMSQTKSGENGHDSFEELQRMFLDMFQDDLDAGFGDSSIYSSPQARSTDGLNCSMPSGLQFADGGSNGSNNCSMPSGLQFADGGSNGSNKRGNSEKAKLDGLENSSTGFCFGLNDAGQSSKGKGSTNSKRRNGRKQKVSSKHDVSSCEAEGSF